MKDPGLPPEGLLAQIKKPQTRSGWMTEERSYELITPLFGGGARPRQADEVTTVRSTEVRGHLRFWWRATRGGHYQGDPARMRAAEEMLWGAASLPKVPRPSMVQVEVSVADGDKGKPDAPYEVVHRRDNAGTLKYRGDGTPEPQIRARLDSAAPHYAAFPLQPKQEDAVVGMTTDKVEVGIKFTLRLSFPQKWEDWPPYQQAPVKPSFYGSPQEEIRAALWAWETFGGLGARTRRGFGALGCITSKSDGKDMEVDRPSTADSAVQWLLDHLAQHVVKDGQWPDEVPHLLRQPACRFRSSLIAGPKSVAGIRLVVVAGGWHQAKNAWDHLINQLQAFRQMRPGRARSHWPEPDQIRYLTKQWLQTPAKSHPRINYTGKFPRAVFGLPIVFHFIQQSRNVMLPNDLKNDPNETTLIGRPQRINNREVKYERLASPLILRPLCCGSAEKGEVATATPSAGAKVKNGPPAGREGKQEVVALALILEAPLEPPNGLRLDSKDHTKHWDSPEVTANLSPSDGAALLTANGQQIIAFDSQVSVLQAFLNTL